MDSMSKEQAIQVIESMASQFVASGKDHEMIRVAIETIKKLKEAKEQNG